MIRATVALALAAGLAQGQLATINGSGTVNGNGNAGFGGEIGNGSLTVETLADGTVNLTLNHGSDSTFDNVGIYVDSVAGGINDTTGLTDSQDNGRGILSGGNGVSDLGFAAGFNADYGITFDQFFSGIFGLTPADPANLDFVAGIGTDMSRSPEDAVWTASFNLSQIGLTAGDSFTFVLTYGNGGNYRSGEFIGANPDQGSYPDGGNIGANFFQLGDNDYVLVNSVPAPGALALLGLGGLTATRRRR
ncbi:MAG: hypothetical protein CMJ31_04745 [Phycisphaerae bacterium]|nr:hypothetical protein [Phycisphaerae bacterium]